MSSDINVQTFSGKVNITSNLLVGSSHLFVDTINNRVGLVTTTPDAGIHVNSNAYVHTDFRVGSGIVMNDTSGRITAGAFHGDGTNITGINSDSGSWVNGTDVVYLSTIGDKVGIGVADPQYKLDVAGDINITTGSTLRVGGTPAVFSNWSVDGSDIYRSSGNVGIGVTDPTYKLDVLDAIRIRGDFPTINFSEGGAAATRPLFRIFNDGANQNDNNNYLAIQRSISSSAYESIIHANLAGNVGIGKTDPGSKLDVDGTVTATSFSGSLSTSVTPGSYLTGSAYNGSTARTFAVDATTDATVSKIVARDSGGDIEARYVIGSYMNMSHTRTNRNSDTIFYSSTDNYIRKNTASGMISSLGLANSATIEATTADTPDKIPQRDGSGDIFARLFRSDYQNQSTCTGAIAFRTSTSDNYIRFCSDMGAVRSRIGAYGNGSNITRTTFASGYMIGHQNGGDGGSDGKTNPIYTIGTSHLPTDTSLSNMYGIGFSHGNFTTLLTGGWGLYVAADGDIRIGLNASHGRIMCTGYVHSAFDTNTTSYFGRSAIGYCGHDDYCSIAHIDRNNTSDYALLQSTGGTTYLNCNSSQAIQFRSGNGDRMTMLANGNLGIGTTSPYTKLHIVGGAGGHNTSQARFFRYNVNFQSHTGAQFNAMSIWATDDIISQGYVGSSSGTVNSSDRRIKKDILDVNDDSALQQLRLVKPKTYKYIDYIGKGDTTVYGFIAQEVRETIPEATQLRSYCIPNIYEFTHVSDTNIITFTTFNTTDLTTNTSTIEIRGKDNSPREVKIVEVMGDHTVRVDTDLTEWCGDVDENGELIEGNGIFVYGEKVDDFVFLKKDYIFTIATAALQEVDRQLQAEKVKNRELQQKVEILEMSHGGLIQRIEALEKL